RRGLVIAMSSGIDSSVCAALAARALGADKVFGLILPERDSSPESARKAEMLAKHLGIRYLIEDIAPTLAAIARALPEYRPGWPHKIVISGGLEGRINHFRLVVQPPGQALRDIRLGVSEYLQIVAATNFKQRIRKTLEYFHADRLNYGVIGTPNRLEYDQGFFVKNGDGAADVKPIAHLYKTQVYALARHLGLPEEICSVRPTTDTYSLAQGQDEFYFALPYEQMDLALWGYNHAIEPAALAAVLGIAKHQVEYVYADIKAKRATTRYLHMPPVL